MVKNYLDEYRNSIRDQYDIEKNGTHTNFLLNPSEANLRDLCILLFKENKNVDDLTSFRLYFGFDFSIQTAHELNDIKKLNKFKPIGSFLKRKSKLKNIDGLNLAAMLVGFENRPYNKFSKIPLEEDGKNKNSKNLPLEQEIIDEKKKYPDQEDDKKDENQPILGIISKPDKPEKPNWLTRNKNKVVIASGVLVLVYFGMNYFMTGKACMEWIDDHYEVVDCDTPNEDGNRYISPKKDDSFIENFKRIMPCDTTSYKDKNGNACLWYGKSASGNMEFFNALHYHPETNKTLKEVSYHIFNNYIEGTPCE